MIRDFTYIADWAHKGEIPRSELTEVIVKGICIYIHISLASLIFFLLINT